MTVELAPQLCVATVADRLRTIRYAQALAAAGLFALGRHSDLNDSDRFNQCGKVELSHAILDRLRVVDGELVWLNQLPTRVLRMPAPTQDEREEAERETPGR